MERIYFSEVSALLGTAYFQEDWNLLTGTANLIVGCCLTLSARCMRDFDFGQWAVNVSLNNTKTVFCETISNMHLQVMDIGLSPG